MCSIVSWQLGVVCDGCDASMWTTHHLFQAGFLEDVGPQIPVRAFAHLQWHAVSCCGFLDRWISEDQTLNGPSVADLKRLSESAFQRFSSVSLFCCRRFPTRSLHTGTPQKRSPDFFNGDFQLLLRSRQFRDEGGRPARLPTGRGRRRKLVGDVCFLSRTGVLFLFVLLGGGLLGF